MRLTFDGVKHGASERLFYAVQECVWAGLTASEIRQVAAESYELVLRDMAKEGAALLRGGER